MKPSQPRPEYEALVERIASGEITRLQAADLSYEITGLRPQTFLSWLRTSGNAKKLTPTRRNAGASSTFAHTDPDKIKAYDDALALALSNKVSIRAAAAKYKVSYPYLLRKVRKAGGTEPKKPVTLPQQTKELDVGDIARKLADDPRKREALAKALKDIGLV